MLKLNKMTDYSTVIMFFMARRPDTIHSAAEVAEAIGVALPTVSKILKMLARRDLLRSIRGVRGGYVLARAPEEISVAQVIDAMEGDFGVTDCSRGKAFCPQESGCPARSPWRQINRTIRLALEGVNLVAIGSGAPKP